MEVFLPASTRGILGTNQSQSHFTDDSQSVSQSVSMSWRRAHLGTCDQILRVPFRERERERVKKVGGVVRDTTVLEGGVIET
jgi:hypothetical protein